MATTTTPKTKPAKTRTTYTPSERAVRSLTGLSLIDINKFVTELCIAEPSVADYIVKALDTERGAHL